jgi:trans-aconitate methyltransferase
MPITRRAAIVGAAFSAIAVAQKPQADRYPDAAPYVPSPVEVVDAMLDLAGVRQDDVVYDLGCGDGRIVVAAARKFGARGVGVDVDSDLIVEARRRAEAAGVSARTRFEEADIFETDIRPATVVALYLMPAALKKLKPKLLAELKPGARIVSFTFPIDDWPPAKVKELDTRRLYLWVIPERPKG